MINEHLEQVKFDTSNPESRCPCVLLVDVSGSMVGHRIDQLNNGIIEFQQALQNDGLAAMRVEVAIVSFGYRVTVEQDFITADQFQAKPLHTGGATPMGKAIDMALNMVRERKDTYKQNGVSYYRPWIFLITDGAPTDKWQAAAQRIKTEENTKSVAFFAVGVEDADMGTLSQISDRQPIMLNGLQFKEMFVWLSQSLTSVSHSQVDEQVPLTPPGWGSV
ncbi:MAG: VWA domain-containing protein [Candidatus Electrothrix sp. AU1_5]|nr:VWA domain-containing protein [Candidatus Electrothrix gigas]